MTAKPNPKKLCKLSWKYFKSITMIINVKGDLNSMMSPRKTVGALWIFRESAYGVSVLVFFSLVKSQLVIITNSHMNSGWFPCIIYSKKEVRRKTCCSVFLSLIEIEIHVQNGWKNKNIQLSHCPSKPTVSI